MIRPASPLIRAALLLLPIACDDATEPLPPHNFFVTGDRQNGTVGEPLAETVVIEMRRPDGSPLPAFDATIRNISGNPTVLLEGGSSLQGDGGTIRVTVEDGVLELRITLGTVPALAVIEVTVPGIVANPAVLVITAFGAAGPIENVAIAGDGQLGGSGDALALPVAVILTDRYDNAIPFVEVTWTPADGAGTTDPLTSMSNDAGAASTSWTLGPGLGVQALDVTVPGAGTFHVHATAVATGG